MSGLVGALEWHKPLLVGLMYTPELKHPDHSPLMSCDAQGG